MKPVEAVLVGHTHWDREWYLPFQQFRARLVGTVDYVMELLERDERFTSFTLTASLSLSRTTLRYARKTKPGSGP